MSTEPAEPLELFSNVLLIEDEAAHADLIRRMLRGLVGEVSHVTSGAAGIEQLQTSFIDLVLCDLNLPDMTALQILEHARAVRPALPFVVLTSSSDLENAVAAMRSGASDYMVKSFSSELRGRLQLVLGRLAEEERRRADELRLRAERDAFWTAAHTTTDGLAILGSESKIVFENRAFLGFRKSIDPLEVTHDVADLLNHVSPSVAEALREQLSTRSHSALWRTELAVPVQSESGTVTRYFELSLTSVAPPQIQSLGLSEESISGLRRLILWTRDITGRKDQERMNRDLLATTTHDLKGPLGAIINSSELLEQILVNCDPKADELITRIASCSRNCITLIDELLSARRIQDGVFVVKPRWGEVEHELHDIVLDYLPMAKSRGIRFGTKAGSSAQIFADTLGFRRVLGNLVSNALKFTPHGGSVELSAEKVEGEVRVAISDTGPGIDSALQHTLFEKYGRLDRDQAIDGTGLGLFVTKNIVDAHGGKIEVRSELGKGTTFIVSFPDEVKTPAA